MVPTASVLHVAARHPGAGSSTVALALAGLLAWSGLRCAVVGGDDLLALAGLAPWRGPGADDLSRAGPAAAAEAGRLAVAVPGVDRLSALGGRWPRPEAPGWPFDAVVADLGTHARRQPAPAVICGRDADGGRWVVVAGRRRRLQTSARVARAGRRGRVPAGLPGSWLADLGRLASAR